MRLGINYPWFKYGWDFGLPPSGWQPRAAWREVIDADLTSFVDSGIDIVRWFILADGTSYGYGASAPQREGGQWRLNRIPSPDPPFLDDFETLLQACERKGVQLLPVLIDFHWAFPGYDSETADTETLNLWQSDRDTASRLPRGVVKGGRGDVLIDQAKRNAFFSRVLMPLLNISCHYSSTIYAWELINEPEWITQGQLGGDPRASWRIPRDEMLAFLSQGLSLIGRHGFRPTVGFLHARTLGDWDMRLSHSPARRTMRSVPRVGGLGLGLNQIHYYPTLNSPPLPTHFPNRQPAVLGEFASRIPGSPPPSGINCNGHPDDIWPDLTDQSVAMRLRRAQTLGYDAAFPWAFRSKDCHTAGDMQSLLEMIRTTFSPTP
jgi:hypothetical protein